MEFKTPKMKDVTSVATQVVSATAGAMVSNVAVAKIIGEAKDNPDAKKFENKKRMVKGIAAAASLVGMACVKGDDTSANVVKGALLGAGITQGISLIKEFIDEKDKTSQTLKQAVGLGCPCEQGSLNSPEWIIPVRNYYDYADETSYQSETIEKSRNPLASFSKSQLNGFARTA